jgi:hypothetical protein
MCVHILNTRSGAAFDKCGTRAHSEIAAPSRAPVAVKYRRRRSAYKKELRNTSVGRGSRRNASLRKRYERDSRVSFPVTRPCSVSRFFFFFFCFSRRHARDAAVPSTGIGCFFGFRRKRPLRFLQ